MRPRWSSAPRDPALARGAAALAASCLVNAAILAALVGAGAFSVAPRRGEARVALARVAPERWEENRWVEPVPGALATAATPAPARAAPPVRPPEPRDPAGQVVAVAPAQDPRLPDRARFLAERDGRTERETQWRGSVLRGAPLAPRPVAGKEDRGIPEPSGEEGRAEVGAPGREGERPTTTRSTTPTLTPTSTPTATPTATPTGTPTPTPTAERLALARLALAPGTAGGDGGARREGRFDPRLLPVGTGAGADGAGSPSAERLPGVADGDATVVNTIAFRFAGFYRRVRDAIAGEWDPNRAWDARDPRDRVYGRATRRAVVDIVLERDGRLRDARLVRGSGLDFFDREVLRAVAAAAPFPNPPRGLVRSDGLVVLQGWTMVFDFGPDALLDRLLPARTEPARSE